MNGSTPWPVTGVKRVTGFIPSNIAKRPHVILPGQSIGPMNGQHANNNTPGGGPAEDYIQEALTTSRFDDEFGDVLCGSELDQIMKLTNAALKSSGLAPIIPRARKSSESAAISQPNYLLLPESNLLIPPPSLEPRSANDFGVCNLMATGNNQAPVNAKNYASNSLPLTFQQWCPPPAAIHNSMPPVPPPLASLQPAQPSRTQAQMKMPAKCPATAATQSMTRHESSSKELSCVIEQGQSQPGSRARTPESEIKRLQTALTSCSHERSVLRLQQKKLQAEIAEKSGALVMLRVKLNGLQSELQKTHSEMNHRLAQERDAHRAQHERMQSQITSLSLERESMERELEELGRTNGSLTRALSSERQNLLSLKRQLTNTANSNQVSAFTLQKSSPSCTAAALSTLSRNDSDASFPESHYVGNGSSRYAVNIKPARKGGTVDAPGTGVSDVLSRIVSSSLERGVLELMHSADNDDVPFESVSQSIDPLGLLISGIYPAFYAVPILKRIIDCGKSSVILPALKILCTLVLYNPKCRQSILGSLIHPASLNNPDLCSVNNPYLEYLNEKCSPNPIWLMPGTCFLVSDAILAQSVSPECQLKSLYKVHDDSTATADVIECPEMLNTILLVLGSFSKNEEITELALLIISGLLHHAHFQQIKSFRVLFDSGILSSLIVSTFLPTCRTLTLRIATHLLRWDENLSALIKRSSSGESLLSSIYALISSRGDPDTDQWISLRLAVIDLIGFIIGRFGDSGISALLHVDSANQQPYSEVQLLPLISLMITAELDCISDLSSKRLQLVYRGLSLIEALLPHVNIMFQISGYRFSVLSMLTRAIQIDEEGIADQASMIRANLIESGCLDLLQEPERTNDSSSPH